jgi:hypothetical protein
MRDTPLDCPAFGGWVSTTDFRTFSLVWGTRDRRCKGGPSAILLRKDELFGGRVKGMTGAIALDVRTRFTGWTPEVGPAWRISIDENCSWHYHHKEA